MVLRVWHSPFHLFQILETDTLWLLLTNMFGCMTLKQHRYLLIIKVHVNKKKIFLLYFLTKGVPFLKLVQTFSGNMYSQYCDCAKFIYAVEPLEEDSDNNNSAQEGSSKVI